MGQSEISVANARNGASDLTSLAQFVCRGTIPLYVYAGLGTTGWRTYAASSSNWLFVPNGTITNFEFLVNVLPGGDNNASYQLGSSAVRWHSAWLGREYVKTHAAFAGSQSARETGAVQTTTNAATACYTSAALVDNSGTWVEAYVTARDTGGADRVIAVRRALVTRQAGGAAAVVAGSLQTVGTDVLPAGYAVTIDTTGNTFRVMVTGVNLVTINWTCTVSFQTVSGNA